MIHLSLGGNEILGVERRKRCRGACEFDGFGCLNGNLHVTICSLPAEPTLKQLFVAKTTHVRWKAPIQRQTLGANALWRRVAQATSSIFMPCYNHAVSHLLRAFHSLDAHLVRFQY